MKNLIILFMVLVTFPVMAQFNMVSTNTATFRADALAPSYTNFTWAWWRNRGQAIDVTFDTSQTNIAFRMRHPIVATNTLTITNATITGLTNFFYTIQSDVIPPAGVYYAEFLGFDNSLTTSPARVLSAGQIKIHYSAWDN